VPITALRDDMRRKVILPIALESLPSRLCAPIRVQETFLRMIRPLVGMRSKVIALGLREVQRQSLASIAIEITETGSHGGNSNAIVLCSGECPAPSCLRLLNASGEIRIE